MKLDQLFDKCISRQNIDNSEIPYTLSNEYIDLMKTYNLQNIKIKYLKIFFRHGTGDFLDYVCLTSILDFQNLIRINKYFYTEDVDDVLIQNGLVIIGETSVGSISLCMGTLDTNFGEIYIYGWDLGVIKIANSFEEFIDSLQPESEIS